MYVAGGGVPRRPDLAGLVLACKPTVVGGSLDEYAGSRCEHIKAEIKSIN
jgi:hypothetical protein